MWTRSILRFRFLPLLSRSYKDPSSSYSHDFVSRLQPKRNLTLSSDFGKELYLYPSLSFLDWNTYRNTMASSKFVAPVCSNSSTVTKVRIPMPRHECSTSSTFMKNTLTIPQMPGVRCPNCQAQGKEVWVIPGKNCHICHTPCAWKARDPVLHISHDNRDHVQSYVPMLSGHDLILHIIISPNHMETLESQEWIQYIRAHGGTRPCEYSEDRHPILIWHWVNLRRKAQ